MNSRNFLTVVMAAATLSMASIKAYSAVVSGPIYNPANGHNYYMLSSSTWTVAESQAIGLGGHLVTVNDAAENSWLQSTFSLFGGVRRDLWIGLNDLTDNGNYTWTSGEPVNFVNWTPDNPNDFLNQSVVFLYSGPGPGQPAHIPGWSAGQWDTYGNSATYDHTGPGIREIVGVVEVPEPSAMALVMCTALGVIASMFSGRRSGL